MATIIVIIIFQGGEYLGIRHALRHSMRSLVGEIRGGCGRAGEGWGSPNVHLIVEKFVRGVFESVPLHLHKMVPLVVVFGDDDSLLVETSSAHDHGDDDEEHDNEDTSTQSHDDRESKR